MNVGNILETIKMIDEEQLDIRTITMGISLLDCIDPDGDKAREKIYNKIMSSAKDLVKVGKDIEREFGIPIVNKRVSVTPISIIAGATDENDYVKFAQTLDKAAEDLGIDFIGGFSALVQKGYTKGDKILIKSIPKALASTNKVCASVNVGSTRCGINMDAVKEMGEIIKETAELTKDAKGFGCAKLVVFCNAVEDNPFMAGAFHGVGEADRIINVGVSGPGVVKRALEKVKGEPFDVVSETVKKTAFKITRVGQLVAKEASSRLDVPFGIIDLSLAPTPAIGDSVANILEEMGLEVVGTHGTTAALALLNDAVKKGGVMACSHVGGLSGAFIPVSEDAGMIDAVIKGALSIDKLEAMTAICSVGLDMIAVPGNTTAGTLGAMIADEAAIGMINNKTTAVRIIPAPGCDVGDMVEFGGLLGRAPVMPINTNSSELFT
ncbi:PFL family protein, partial [Clostridioides difficile]|nr:PFL family protein [Clostridioides difficile]